MNTRLALVMIFIFGLPVVAGKVRANNIVPVSSTVESPSYMMDMSYKEALKEGEIVNCFSWEEQYTAYEIEIPSTK